VKKMLIAGLAALAGALIIPAAAQASADACFVRGADVSCTAHTSEDRVSFARVKMGVMTRGDWALECTKGSHEFTDAGRLHRGEGYVIPLRLNRPDCTLAAVGFSKSRARVRVVLR
jgi:hypothetical protein